MRRWYENLEPHDGYHHPDPLPKREGEQRKEVVAVFNLTREAREVEFHVAAGKWRKLFESTHQEFDGPGSSLGEEITTDGTISLALPAYCAVMYEKW